MNSLLLNEANTHIESKPVKCRCSRSVIVQILINAMESFFSGVKYILIAIYKIIEWVNICSIIIIAASMLYRPRFIDKKTFKMIKIGMEVINIFLAPFLAVFLLRTFCFDLIYIGHSLQSWEYGLFVWCFGIGIYHIFGYAIPGIKYKTTQDCHDWLDKMHKDRTEIKCSILIPFGIDKKKIKSIDTVGMDWHIVLVSLFPAIFVNDTMDFILQDKFSLACGNSSYYKNHDHATVISDQYCYLISKQSQWYKYYFTNQVSSMISAWAVITTLATFIIKYGNNTCNYHKCMRKNGPQVGGKIQLVDQSSQINKLAQAVVLLRQQIRQRVDSNDQIDNKLNVLLQSFDHGQV